MIDTGIIAILLAAAFIIAGGLALSYRGRLQRKEIDLMGEREKSKALGDRNDRLVKVVDTATADLLEAQKKFSVAEADHKRLTRESDKEVERLKNVWLDKNVEIDRQAKSLMANEEHINRLDKAIASGNAQVKEQQAQVNRLNTNLTAANVDHDATKKKLYRAEVAVRDANVKLAKIDALADKAPAKAPPAKVAEKPAPKPAPKKPATRARRTKKVAKPS